MVKIERVVAKRRGLMSVSVSSVRDELPERYAVALVDKSKVGAAHQGRVLAYDRGHCEHHGLAAGSQCHCHREGAAVSSPSDCRFIPVLSAFCSEALAYWKAEGLGDLTSAGIFDATAIVDDLQEEKA